MALVIPTVDESRESLMTVENAGVIDFVAHDPKGDALLLVMVEAREWGERGALLPGLQRKLNTYLDYATGGQLASDYPAMIGKPIQIELRSTHAPGDREREFLKVAISEHLAPAGIRFRWKVIGEETSGSI